MDKINVLEYGIFVKFENSKKALKDLRRALDDGFYFGVARLEDDELEVLEKCISLTFEELFILREAAFDNELPIYIGKKDAKIHKELWKNVMED